MATYLLKRKSYAVVRNPFKEKRDSLQSNQIAEDNGTELAEKNVAEMTPNRPRNAEELSENLNMKSKTPVYQNLKNNRKADEVNKIMDRDNRRLRNKTVNQNINITRNTNISNPAKEKAAELDAQVKMARLQQKAAEGGGVNAKLIEIQKTNPLKPISMG